MDFRRVIRYVPFLSIHAIACGVLWVGFSWPGLIVAAALFFGRMFVITGFYHRYFSHRTFRTHRVTQFLFALAGTSCAQRGPVWWAAHHREHHRHSDEASDIHSPHQHGLLHSHSGWFLTERGLGTDWSTVPDWAKYPELRWLEKWHIIGPLGLAVLMYGLGVLLTKMDPTLNTSGWSMLVWGFGVSTVALYHGTFTINSLAHTLGRRRFATTDDSRNSLLLSLLTLGEGWHNNHHYCPGTVRQGFYWWEIDITYYVLRTMSMVGLVWDLRPVPQRVYAAAESIRAAQAGKPLPTRGWPSLWRPRVGAGGGRS